MMHNRRSILFKRNAKGHNPIDASAKKPTQFLKLKLMTSVSLVLVFMLSNQPIQAVVIDNPEPKITFSEKPVFLGLPEIEGGDTKIMTEIDPIVLFKSEPFEVDYGFSKFFSRTQISDYHDATSVAEFSVLDHWEKHSSEIQLDYSYYSDYMEKAFPKHLSTASNNKPNPLRLSGNSNTNLLLVDFEKYHFIGKPIVAPITTSNDEYPKADMAQVMSAVRKASSLTGMDPAFLMAVAWKESRFNPYETTGYTSAGGMFQFLDQSWLVAVKRYGAKHGQEQLANAITQNANGDMRVNNSKDLKAIMSLRHNIEFSAIMAAESMLEDKHSIEMVLGRPARPVDLYLTHLMGLGGASGFLRNNGVSTAKYAQLTHVVEKQRAIYSEMLASNPVGSSGYVTVTQVDEKLDREPDKGRILQKK